MRRTRKQTLVNGSPNAVSYNPSTQKRYQDDELEELRNELFAHGSSFKPVSRDEIIGVDNVLVKIDRIIHWLKHSDEYNKHNSRLEPGVIFEGDPGTGKTLVSRYIASASDATFINVRDFDHMESLFRDFDIADLFNRARRKYAETRKPVILFWDEFEGVAINREEGSPEQVATVSQITAELDGVHGKNEGILLIGCTNHIFGIDEALQRDGRMGLTIEFHAPDRAGKQSILQHYLKPYGVQPTKKEIDIETLSYFFDSDATAASIEEACVEAWRFAVYRIIETKGQPKLTEEDLMNVFIERLVGPPSSFMNLSEELRHRIAIHECGHAIMALVMGIPLRLITIHPGQQSLGRIQYDEIQEHIATHSEYTARMSILSGSLAAEKEVGFDPMVGATQDIEEINMYASRLVDDLNYGSRTGIFSSGAMADNRISGPTPAHPNVSDYSIEDADRDVHDLISETDKNAQKVMAVIGAQAIHDIADVVCKETTMTGTQFEKAFAKILGIKDFTSLKP